MNRQFAAKIKEKGAEEKNLSLGWIGYSAKL